MAACRECHKAWDSYQYDVVDVPIDRKRKAYYTILSLSKVFSLGDRP
jgi:hypothetical protein